MQIPVSNNSAKPSPLQALAKDPNRGAEETESQRWQGEQPLPAVGEENVAHSPTMQGNAQVQQLMGKGMPVAQREGGMSDRETPVQRQEEEKTAENNTGLPDRLKEGIERMSGYDLSGVRVNYNSPKPAQLNAHAYTQGHAIEVAPGQERHLPHEAWHVVQQMQGRVRPTMEVNGVGVNGDRGLEREADVMGRKALAIKAPPLDQKTLVGAQQAHKLVEHDAHGMGSPPKQSHAKEEMEKSAPMPGLPPRAGMQAKTAKRGNKESEDVKPTVEQKANPGVVAEEPDVGNCEFPRSTQKKKEGSVLDEHVTMERAVMIFWEKVKERAKLRTPTEMVSAASGEVAKGKFIKRKKELNDQWWIEHITIEGHDPNDKNMAGPVYAHAQLSKETRGNVKNYYMQLYPDKTITDEVRNQNRDNLNKNKNTWQPEVVPQEVRKKVKEEMFRVGYGFSRE